MELLILGLAIFLGIHLLPMAPPLRAALRARAGEGTYKTLFSIVSALGLVLIVWGYAVLPRGEQLFAPLPGAKAIAPLAMTVAFILLAAANMRTHIRRTLGHPMLLGIVLWSAVHLMANGHQKAVLLFGAFLAYAAVDLASAVSRRAVKTFEPQARHDLIAVGGGIGVAVAVMATHRWFFGVPAVPWGF